MGRAAIMRLKGTRRGSVTAGEPRSGRLGRRLAGAAALVLLAGLSPAVPLGATPAQAATGCNPHYWWTPFDSTSSWVDSVFVHGNELLCTTSPAIARYTGYTNGSYIVAALQDMSAYRAYRNDDGAPYWDSGGIWPGFIKPGIAGAPSLISDGSNVDYAFTYGNGANGNDLYFGWAPYGYAGVGQLSQVTTGSMLEPWAPGMARTSRATEIAATGVDYSLWFYWNFDGSPNWGSERVTGIWRAFDAPSVTATDAATEISAIAPGGSLWFYWAANGTSTWHPEEVAGPGSAAGGQAMTHSNGAIEIAAAAPDGSLWFYWAADYTNTWHAEEVAGPGSVSGTPAMVGAGGSMEIAATGADGSLWFYWAYDGTSTWHPQLLSGPGTTFASPAMVASSGTYEIVTNTQ